MSLLFCKLLSCLIMTKLPSSSINLLFIYIYIYMLCVYVCVCVCTCKCVYARACVRVYQRKNVFSLFASVNNLSILLCYQCVYIRFVDREYLLSVNKVLRLGYFPLLFLMNQIHGRLFVCPCSIFPITSYVVRSVCCRSSGVSDAGISPCLY